MVTSFLITLREGLEASLIIAILLTYLTKTNRREEAKYVWMGTGAAIAACLVAGTLIYILVDGLHGNAEYAVEGVIALPTLTRANSLGQYLFVNGRPVRDKLLLGVVRGGVGREAR